MSELDVAVEDAASDTQPLVPTAAGPAGLDVQIAAELLERARTQGVSLVGQGGLLQQVTRAVLQAALEAEMADHLGYQRGEAPPVGSGKSPQRIVGQDGAYRGRRRAAAGAAGSAGFVRAWDRGQARPPGGFDEVIVSLYPTNESCWVGREADSVLL